MQQLLLSFKRLFLSFITLLIITTYSIGQSSIQFNSDNVPIPDQGTAYRSISFSGLPFNAEITSVSYDIRFCHAYWGDIASRLDDNFSAIGGQLIVASNSSNNNSGCGYNFNGSTNVFNGESPNKTFYVRAWDDGPADEGYITYVSLTVHYSVPVSIPNTPTGLDATAQGTQSIFIDWNNVSGADTYRLYRATSCNGTYLQIYWASGSSYTDSGSHLNPNTTYYYKVRAENSAGTSNYSSCTSATTFPSSPIVNSVTPTSAIIGQPRTFTISGSNLNNNLVWFIPDFGNGQVIPSNSTTQKQFVATPAYESGIKNGEIKNQAGGTVLENFNVNVSYATPPPPTLSVQGDNAINVSWTGINAAGDYLYRLYRSTSSNFNNATQIRCVLNETNRFDSGNHLSPNTTYYYWIRYCNFNESCGIDATSLCSNLSPMASATTDGTSPSDNDNTPSTANILSLNSFENSSIIDQNDQDWFKVTVPATGALTISVDVFSDFDVQFRLFDNSILSSANPNSSMASLLPTRYNNNDGNPANDNGYGVNEFFENLDVTAGDYYIKVAIEDTPVLNRNYRIYADFVPTPTLTSPNNNATNVSITPTFNWTASSATQYRLQIDNNNNFLSPNFNQNLGNQTAYTLTSVDELLNNTQYFWKVNAAKPLPIDNTKTVSSLDSDIRNFTTEASMNTTCTYNDVDNETPWASAAATCLCEEGVLDDDGMADPTDLLNRAELAKMLYTSINLQNNAFVTNTVHYYPSVFNDLQNTALWDYFYAKTLSYLEYQGDCVTPFDRTAFNFYRGGGIERKYILKAILETFNVNVSNVTGTAPFSDVNSNTEAYPYILKAYQDGIITGDDNSNTFRPNAMTLRAESFVMLCNAIQIYGMPTITAADFYEPGNYTPTNFAQASSSHSGNFNFYTKTSFAISSIGLPLNFGHTYNSYLGDMPKEFFAMQPLGNAWSHSYNMYLLDVPGSQTEDRRLVLVLPDGTVNIFKQNGNTYVPETYGIYSTLTKTSGSTFQLTTKGQIVFTFTLGTTAINSFGTSIYQLTRIQDRNNNTVSLTYENAMTTSFARLKSIRGTAGRYIRLYYENNSDRIRRVIDPLGRAIFYTYQQAANGKEQLKTFSNAKGDITTYNYNNSDCDAHLLESITLPKGNTIDNQYENRKLLSTQTNSANLTTFTRNFVHNANGTVVNSTTDIADYGIITSTHNRNGLLTDMTTPSADLNIDYSSPNSTLPSIINSSNLNEAMVYTYDDKANVLEINMPEGVRHQFTYEDFNDLKTYTNPNNQTWTYGYDANGNLITQQSPRAMTTMNRLSNGLVSRITNPENIITNFSYDNYGNVENVNIPAEGISSAAEYDIASRLIESTNPNGQKTFYTYDENDNLLTSQFTYTSQYQYDKNDNLTRITNAKGIATNLSYDFQNDFHTGTSFAGMNDAYTYYEDGRLESHTNPKGTTFTYNYDNQNRIQSLNSPGDNVTYSYDNLDRMTSVSNHLGTVQFAYDNLNRVTSTTDTYGNTVSYTYDPASNITHITYPDGKVVTYTYYNDNLLHTVKDWNNQTTTYTYRDDGLLSRIDYPNGAECSYQYDGAGRNTNQTWQRNNVILASYARTFDPFGNIIQEEATHPLEATTPSDKNVTYSYEANNQIAVANTTTFDFDADGTASSKSNAYTYTFDNYERLTGISGDLTAAFDYDAMGHRRSKTVNGTTTRFALDILGMSKVLMEKTASGTVQNYYVYGLTLISRIGGDGNTTHYYHGDYRGSTVAMTDASGTTTHRYAYGSYGQNLGVDEPSGDSNPFRYVGMYGVQYEADDLYFMRARYYDGEVGRFLSEDPVWGENLYGYGNNNPISLIDPKGATAEWVESLKYTLQVEAKTLGHYGKGIYNTGLVFSNGFEGSFHLAKIKFIKNPKQRIKATLQLTSSFISSVESLNNASKEFSAGVVTMGSHSLDVSKDDMIGPYDSQFMQSVFQFNSILNIYLDYLDFVKTGDLGIEKDISNISELLFNSTNRAQQVEFIKSVNNLSDKINLIIDN